MAGGPGARGKSIDFMNWFKIGDYAEKNKVILPAGENMLPPAPVVKKKIPDYMKPDFGQEYAYQYQQQHIEDYKANRVPVSQPLAPSEMSAYDSLDALPVSDEADAVNVYLKNDFSVHDPTCLKLPVHGIKKEILEKLATYQAVVIKGETGCGKSTQVAQIILDDACENLQYCNIIITQPRKLAAISLAKRVAQERRWSLPGIVGYQVGLDNNTTIDTRICYVTTEVLVQKMISKKNLSPFTHIILDEIHERDQHIDFALLIVKKLMHTVSRNVKVVLMSATINAEKFTKYFATPVKNQLIDAPLIEVKEPVKFKLRIHYLDKLSSVRKVPSYDYSKPDISYEMYELAISIIHEFDRIERQDEMITSHTQLPSKRNAVLMFLPGLAQIENMREILRNYESEYKWQAFPLHSTITIEEQNKVFSEPSQGFRKIILSTNIAESSITVPDVQYVIDFCLTKLLQMDPLTNFQSLKLSWTSKASCRQRAGRAGRVADGWVYRLVHKNFFETLLDYTEPEMSRTPLSLLVLKCKILDMGSPQSLLALALDPPDLRDIFRTILDLKKVGALTIKFEGKPCSSDGELTFFGKTAAKLPVDLLASKLIVLGFYFGCLEETIIIAAGLTLKSIHSTPFQRELQAFLARVSWCYNTFSDCFGILHAYTIWKSNQVSGKFKNKSKEKAWADNCMIQLKNLKEVDVLKRELEVRLKSLKIQERNIRNPPREHSDHILKICMAAAFFPNYFKRKIYNDYEREVFKELNGNDPYSTVIIAGLPDEGNVLYTPQIKTLLKDSCPDVLISYTGRKAYVQFPRKSKSADSESNELSFSDIPGEFPTAMYLAIKMRQIPRISRKFYLNTYSREETVRHMERIRSDDSSFIYSSKSDLYNSTFSLDSSSMNYDMHVLDLSDDKLNYPPPAIPTDQDTLENWKAQISYIEDAGHVWLLPQDPESIKSLGEIDGYIALKTLDNLEVIPEDEVKPGLLGLAYFTYLGVRKLCRIKVKEILPNQHIWLHVVDYGTYSRHPSNHIFKLPIEIRPKTMAGSEIGWSRDATKFMKRYQFKTVFAFIYSFINGAARVILRYRNANGELDILNRLLIIENFAIKAEECYMSKHDHEMRRSMGATFPSNNANTLSSLSSFSHSPSVLRLNMLLPPEDTNDRKRLHGPRSPLEMLFLSLSRTGISKGVSVDSNSVNSVSLDPMPQSLHDRFIIGANVSLNQSESSINLRYTTLMPPIPGLLSICLVAFCPCAELRVSAKGDCYTGALIGLGQDEDNEPLYAHEDIEFEFDIPFTHHDLILINKIRHILNYLLKEGDEVPDQVIIKYQIDLRKIIIELMDENRKYFAPQCCQFPFRWNKIPKEDIMRPQIMPSDSDVYPLHSLVMLQGEKEIKQQLEEFEKQDHRIQSLCMPNKDIKLSVMCILCEITINCVSEWKEHTKSSEHVQMKASLEKAVDFSP